MFKKVCAILFPLLGCIYVNVNINVMLTFKQAQLENPGLRFSKPEQREVSSSICFYVLYMLHVIELASISESRMDG